MVAVPASSVETPLRALRSAVDALGSEPLEALSETALEEDLIGLRRQVDRLEAEFCRRLRRLDTHPRRAGDGPLTTVGWLRHACGMTGSDAMQRVAIARRLDVVAGAPEAFADGDIGVRHAAVLARCVEEVGEPAARECSAALLDAARRLDAGGLCIVTRHLRHCVDPDGTLDDARRAHQRRWLHVSGTVDVVAIDGQLDLEDGEIVRTAIEALARPGPGDERTPAQRRADALVELARRQLQQGGLPSANGVRPHIVVTASAATLRREPATPAAELGRGATIVAEAARRLACDAAITEVAVDEDGSPLSLARTRRTAPPSLRRALGLRDRGCRFPGCDRPVEWTDAHHLVHWTDGGPTELANMVLLCRRHHRAVHEGGWALERKDDGTVVAVPP